MTELSDKLFKQLRFTTEASNYFLSRKHQRLTGQQRVLAVLAQEDAITQSYLGELLDLRPSSLAELLKKMEEAGDISRTESEDDKRIKFVHLTEAGHVKADKITALKQSTDSDVFFAGLTADEQQQFSDLLGKIADGWDDDLKHMTDRFVDPLDRMKMVQGLRDEILAKFDNTDWESMTPDERHHFQHEMRKAAKEAGLDWHRGPHGGFNHADREEFVRDFQEHRGGFHRPPFERFKERGPKRHHHEMFDF